MAATQSLSSSLSKPTPLSPPLTTTRFFPKSSLPFTLSDPKKPSFTVSSKNPISDIILSNKPKTTPQDDAVFLNDDKPREECGVVGIYGDSEASRLCYLALHALQHRGQEGAGIVTVNNNILQSITGVGLVSDVFNETKLDQLPGSLAIGHVRYSTAGQSMLKNVQPFVAGYRFGSVGVAHNGNLVNYRTLRAKLEERGSIFNTTSDTEVVLHLIATSKHRPFILRIVDACEKLEGAYSIVFVTEDKLVAVRDPFGFRPLVMGRRSNGAVVFASETCALDLIEATYEREVFPGEVIVVDNNGIQSLCLMSHPQPKQCIFEHIYFALPNSVVFGRSVYESRRRFGEVLATESPVDCDVVIAVPDSGVVAALGYAAKAGVPFQQGLIRSHYVGRTFIEPSQKIRDFGVKLKLSPVRAVLEGKRVVVVDDSIVRGTTSSKIVRLLKEAGAKEVHMRIASPPIIGSCYYGVDTPSSEELISNRMSVEEIRDFIGCDSLAFLPINSLHSMLGNDSPNFCYACFSGKYPVEPRELKVKRVGDFVDDGLNGSLEQIDGGWVQANRNPKELFSSFNMSSRGNGTSVAPDDDDDDIQILETPPAQVNQPQQANHQDNTNTPKEKEKKKRALTSDVWNDMVKIGIGEDGKQKCKCKGCGNILGCESLSGTSHLSRHILHCKFLRDKFGDVGDMLIDVEGKLKRKKFDQKANREILAEMIIAHGAPFNIVEWKVFRKYQKFMNEECKWISRNTIKADVLEIYKVEKEKLKLQLAQIPGRVCLTSDCWTSCTNNGYISLTVHFVDVKWRWNSKILAFSHLKPPHSGPQLALKVMELLREWGIERKVFSLTLDNASANDNMQNYLKQHLGLSNSLLLNGEFFHIRCCAHILNLIVQDGLKIASDALHKIRQSVSYVRASESRTIQFFNCVNNVEGIDTSIGLRTDTPTRWNSTFIMLESAINYRRAFYSLSLCDPNYKLCPSSVEWDRAEIMCEFLRPFYNITNLISGSSYPTSNLYVREIWKIETLLSSNLESEDDVISSMAVKMKDKFDKYWSDYSMVLKFGVVLDPTKKLRFLTFAYEQVDPLHVEDKVQVVKNNLTRLYGEYVKHGSHSDASHSKQAQSSFEGGKTKKPKSLYRCDVSSF